MAEPAERRSLGLNAALQWIEDLFAKIDRTVDESVAATLKDVIGEQFEASKLGFIPEVWSQKVSAFMMPVVKEAYDTGAISAAIQLPQAKAAYETAVPNPVPDVLNPLQSERMAASLNRLNGIGDHIWQQAREGLTFGMERGEGIEDLAARVVESAEVSVPRATTIARTEVISAANAGSMDQARIFQPYAPVRKEWLATEDARTRISHRAADGQEVTLEGRFTVGGHSLDFPGDPGGPPGEVINCRCTVLFNDAPIDEVLPPKEPNVVPEPQSDRIDLSTDRDSPFALVAEGDPATDPRIADELISDDYRTDRRFKPEQVDPDNLIAAQASVYRSQVEAIRKSGLDYSDINYDDPVIVVRAHDYELLVDGHHRAMAAAADGKDLGALVIDLSKEFSSLEDFDRLIMGLTAAAGPPEEETVPYHVSQDAEGCSGYAVVKDADGEVMGCHDTQEEADAQVAALYANEPEAAAMDAGAEEWHSVLTVEGVRSGDGREFAPGAIDWRNLPLPLMREIVSTHGGTTSETVRTGDITRIERMGGEIHGWGVFHDTPEGEAHRAFVSGGRRGVSIDGDNTTENDIEYIYPDGLDPDSDEAMMSMPEVVLYHYARIMGVTDVPFPAFQEAYIELAGGEEAVPTGAPVTGSGEGDAPEEFINSGAMIALVPDAESVSRLSLGEGLGLEDDDLHLTLRYLGDVGSLDETVHEQALAEAERLATGGQPIDGEAFAAALFNPTGDEPAVVMLVNSDGVRGLEGQIDPALAAPDSHPFNPHMTLEYPDSSSFTDSFQRAVERVGPVRFDHVRVAWGDDNRLFPIGEPAEDEPEDEELLASAFPVKPDPSWFEDPQLNGPTPWTVDDDGRVYGHLALHGTCHIGVAGTCVTPPREKDYSYFRTGSLECSDGTQVPVGQITLGTNHAPKSANQFAAAEHYDHTGTAAADVAAGVDRYGIWVAGAARPHLTDEQVRELRAGAISGDWRKFGTGLRLVAALMVNVPGFPIPRTSTYTRKGEQTALVASGIVTEPAPAVRSQQYYRDRALRIAAAAGLDNESRAARLAATIGRA